MVDSTIEQVSRMMVLRSNLQRSPDGKSIFDLLRQTSSAGVSNPLDRIYSLLGVATREDRQNIPIDYGILLSEVFSAVVQYRIKTQCSLDILFEGWCRGDGILGKDSDVAPHPDYRVTRMMQMRRGIADTLPTWLPNFMKPLRPWPCPWLQFHRYNASLDMHPKLQVEFHSQILELGAIYFDVILDASRKYKLIAPHVDTRQKTGSEDARDVLMPPTALYTVLNVLDQDYTLTPEPYFFRTMRGFIGLSMERPREGDEIIVPFGLSTPAIVRPYLHSLLDETSPPVHTLVCDCYVHGIMNGELMALYKEARIESKTYHLM